MGTRADFYVRKDEEMAWLGSIAWDGHIDSIPTEILNSKKEPDFKNAVHNELSGRDDGTFPEMGWPWPWPCSKLTDKTYVFDCKSKQVWSDFDMVGDFHDYTTPLLFCKIGTKYYDSEKDEHITPKEAKKWLVPNMKHLKNVAEGKRSGLIVINYNPK